MRQKACGRIRKAFVALITKVAEGNVAFTILREVSLQKIVLKAVSDLAEFVRNYEQVFLFLLAKKQTSLQVSEKKRMQLILDNGERRIKELDKLIEKIYEDMVLERLSEERYRRMMQSYEQEQKDLIMDVEKARIDLAAFRTANS